MPGFLFAETLKRSLEARHRATVPLRVRLHFVGAQQPVHIFAGLIFHFTLFVVFHLLIRCLC